MFRKDTVFTFQILSYYLICFSGARFAFNSGFELGSTLLLEVIGFIRMDIHNIAHNKNVRNRKLHCKANSGAKTLAILGDSVLEGQCVSKASFSEIVTEVSHRAEVSHNFLLIRLSLKNILCTFTELVSNFLTNWKEKKNLPFSETLWLSFRISCTKVRKTVLELMFSTLRKHLSH